MSQPIDLNFICPDCHEVMEGDGYTRVYYCPNADSAEVEYLEPDATPVFCEGKEPIE